MVTKLVGGRFDVGGVGEFIEEAGYKFLDSDISSISAGASWTTGSGWVDVRGAGVTQIIVKATGANASSSGTVTFTFGAKPESGSIFPETTVGSFSMTLDLDADNEVVKDALINTEAYGYLKLQSIENGDSSYAVEDVNAYLYYKLKK